MWSHVTNVLVLLFVVEVWNKKTSTSICIGSYFYSSNNLWTVNQSFSTNIIKDNQYSDKTRLNENLNATERKILRIVSLKKKIKQKCCVKMTNITIHVEIWLTL